MRSLRNRLALLFFAITLGGDRASSTSTSSPPLEPTLRDEKLDTPRRGGAARTRAPICERAIDRTLDAQGARPARAPGGRPVQRARDAARRQPRDPGRADLLALGLHRPRSRSATCSSPSPLEAARTRRVATGIGGGRRPAASARRRCRCSSRDRRPSAGRRLRRSSSPRRWATSRATSRSSAARSSSPARSRCSCALLAGYLVARALSRRVERLRARRAARGARATSPRASESAPDDELGQLARALDDMQQPARRARQRAQALHRHRLARAAHADLLARRLPRAARGRGARRGDARRSSSRQLREQVDRLGKLATDLLDLSRLEAGSLELRPEPTDVGDARRRVAAEFAPALAAHDSHLELRLAGEPLEAVCDPERVAQIMRILIDNALTHTPAGHRRRRRRHAGDDGRVRLAVQRLRRRDPPRRRCRASSSRSTPPTTPRAPAWGWPSPASWPSAWTGDLGVDAVPGARRSRWSSPREARRRCAASPPPSRCSPAAAARHDDDDAHGRRRTTTTVEVLEQAGAARRRLRPARRSTSARRPGVVTVIVDRAARRPAATTPPAWARASCINGEGEIATNAHVVTERRGRRDPQGLERLRALRRRQPGRGRGRRLRPVRRRRAAARSTPTGLTLRPLPLGLDQGPARRRAGGRDRQPVRRGAVAVGRRHLGASTARSSR